MMYKIKELSDRYWYWLTLWTRKLYIAIWEYVVMLIAATCQRNTRGEDNET